MNLSAIIAKMRAAGMSSEAILQALESLFGAVKCVVSDEVTERRREADRVRKAVKRQTSADIGGIPRTSADPSPLVPPFPPAPPNPPIIPPSITKPARVKPATALPDDWEPDARTWALADELGFTSQEAWDQLERMRDWAKNADGTKGRKSDWNAAFRNWLKRTADERRSKPEAPRRNNIHDSLAILDAVTDEAIRRASGHGPEGGKEDTDLLPGLRQSAA